MIPKCIPILGVTFMQELPMFRALIRKANERQIEPLGYHWKGFEA
jgi:hypothetical protein